MRQAEHKSIGVDCARGDARCRRARKYQTCGDWRHHDRWGATSHNSFQRRRSPTVAPAVASAHLPRHLRRCPMVQLAWAGRPTSHGAIGSSTPVLLVPAAPCIPLSRSQSQSEVRARTPFGEGRVACVSDHSGELSGRTGRIYHRMSLLSESRAYLFVIRDRQLAFKN